LRLRVETRECLAKGNCRERSASFPRRDIPYDVELARTYPGSFEDGHSLFGTLSCEVTDGGPPIVKTAGLCIDHGEGGLCHDDRCGADHGPISRMP
jgi:hypothetical protein